MTSPLGQLFLIGFCKLCRTAEDDRRHILAMDEGAYTMQCVRISALSSLCVFLQARHEIRK